MTFLSLLKWMGISLSLFLIALVLLYFCGPRAKFEAFDNQPIFLDSLVHEDRHIPHLKPNNDARIIWADTMQTVTDYCFVYLHGFSASPMESDPIPQELAKRFKSNLYLARLDQHGIDDKDAFLHLTPNSYIQSAKMALAQARILGRKIIIISCSTGSTLGLYLSAADSTVAGHIMLSPNIALADPSSFLLSGPWGLQLARWVMGSPYRKWTPENDSVRQYWTCSYRIEGLIAMKYLLDQTMQKEIFKKISHPVFMGYYYKNEKEQDETVSVKAMLSMFQDLSSDSDQKEKKSFPQAATHVIGSKWHYKAQTELYHAIESFLQKHFFGH